MEFSRADYLEKMIKHSGNHTIKIVTGIRRYRKSYLLNHIFYKLLTDSGVKPENIIRFEFDEDIDKLDAFYPELETKIKVDKTSMS